MKTGKIHIPPPSNRVYNLVQSDAYRRSLYEFVRAAWHIVEPAAAFIDNWHIGLICETLQAVSRLQIHNLVINIPPRHMKSLLVSVFWPAWAWIESPHLRWLTGSYAAPLAVRDALKTRRILQSPWYRQYFGDCFELCGDQNMKSRYENNRTGYRLAFGFNAAVTGEGADILVVDDPLKAQDADSPVMRQRVNDAYDGTLTTRANDARSARRVIIMQRLHEDDLTGHVLEKMKMPGAPCYEHICLPTEYEPARFFSSIGRDDPRTQPGQLLWPERFGEKENLAAKADLGLRGYAGQHAQRPAPAGGAVFQAAWWRGQNRCSYNPGRVIGRWLSWDTAFKDGEQNDFSALTVWELLEDYRLSLRFAHWGRYQFPQLAKAVDDEGQRWARDGRLRGIVIEDKASGISALQTLQQAGGWIGDYLQAFQPGQYSKVGRARQASLWCERGCILLPHPCPETPWLLDFEDMLYKFPSARINDPVDSMSQAILFLEHLLARGWQARR